MKALILLLGLFLSGCMLKGTDSGNPGLEMPVNSGYCESEDDSACAQSNPAILLIDQGLCGALNRCGSSLRGTDCRERTLATDTLPIHFGLTKFSDSRAVAIGVREKNVQVDGPALGACVNALDAKACGQIPANENLATTLKTLLAANPECTSVFSE